MEEKSVKRGEKLNQLSRILFDSAANNWYLAWSLEIAIGLTLLIANIFDGDGDNRKLIALIAAAIGIIIAVMRLRFESRYDLAETMRRQSLLTEGLALDFEPDLYNEWRRRCSKKVLKQHSSIARKDGYYQTSEPPGHKKLLEMTRESIFWTKSLYNWLFHVALAVTLVSILTIVGILVTTSFTELPTELADTLAYFAFLLIPFFLTVNTVGYSFRLYRLINALEALEKQLGAIKNANKEKDSVTRLVFEYNCLLASGFPIHKWIFLLNHKTIQQEWEEIYG